MKYLSLLLIMGVDSLCFIGIKLGLPHAPPLLFGALRVSIGGIFLIALMIATSSRLWPTRTSLGWLALLGFVATAASTATMFLAAEHGSAGLASVLGNMQPILTLVLALLILHEKITPGKVWACILGVVGIILISLPVFHSGGTGELRSALFAIGSSSVVAIVNVIVKRVIPEEDLLPAVAWQLIMGCVPLFIVSRITESWSWFHPDVKFISLLLVLGMVGTGFNTFAWYRLVKKEDVSFISMFYFVVPIIGILAGWIAFKETLVLEQWLGMAVIASALVFLAHESKTKRVLAIPEAQA